MSWILAILWQFAFHEMHNSCIFKKPRIWQVFWYMTWYGKNMRKKYRRRQVLWVDALIQLPRKTGERNLDLLTLYRRPNPIKIWPTYAVPPTTTLYPAQHTNYGERDHPRPFFNRLKNLFRSPRPHRAGPTNLRCILDQHTLSPIKARSLPIRPFFQSGRERGLIGSLVWTGL